MGVTEWSFALIELSFVDALLAIISGRLLSNESVRCSDVDIFEPKIEEEISKMRERAPFDDDDNDNSERERNKNEGIASSHTVSERNNQFDLV